MANGVRSAGRLRYVMAADICPDYKEPGLVDGILETKGMTIVYGPSGSGKTAVVVDLGCRIAAGLPWRTREVKRGLVLYVAAENSESTGRRVWAWMRRHEQAALPLALVKSPITMADSAVKEMAVLIAQVEAETGEKVRLIVFDTLARTFGGDENQAKDMGVFVKALDMLKELTEAHILVVHHTGKDEGRGARGSSALKAATDHEIEVLKEKESKIGAITLSKVREGDLEGQRFGYELRPYMLGHNALGREVTTVVTEECGAPVKEKGGNHRAMVEAFFAECQGRVTMKMLKKECQLSEKGPGSSSERMAWKRLLDAGFIEVDDEGVVTLV